MENLIPIFDDTLKQTILGQALQLIAIAIIVCVD
jgi:hypothetical protein